MSYNVWYCDIECLVTCYKVNKSVRYAWKDIVNTEIADRQARKKENARVEKEKKVRERSTGEERDRGKKKHTNKEEKDKESSEKKRNKRLRNEERVKVRVIERK